MLDALRSTGRFRTRKGLSDLISIIILIAFTLSAVVLVGAWITDLARSGNEKNERLISNTIDCGLTSFSVDENSLKYTNGTNGSISFTLLNNGKNNLYNFTIFSLGADEINELTLVNPFNVSDPIKPGQIILLSGYGEINTTEFRVFSRACPNFIVGMDV